MIQISGGHGINGPQILRDDLGGPMFRLVLDVEGDGPAGGEPGGRIQSSILVKIVQHEYPAREVSRLAIVGEMVICCQVMGLTGVPPPPPPDPPHPPISTPRLKRKPMYLFKFASLPLTYFSRLPARLGKLPPPPVR